MCFFQGGFILPNFLMSKLFRHFFRPSRSLIYISLHCFGIKNFQYFPIHELFLIQCSQWLRNFKVMTTDSLSLQLSFSFVLQIYYLFFKPALGQTSIFYFHLFVECIPIILFGISFKSFNQIKSFCWNTSQRFCGIIQ